MTMIVSGAIVCLVAAIALFGIGVLAAADPEGRGGNFALVGVGGGVVFGGTGLGLLIWALVRVLS